MENASIKKFYKFLTTDILTIVEILQEHKRKVYIVGGAIRDYYFNEPINEVDFDIATDATPDEITKWMTEVGIKVKSIGENYGTLLVIVKKKAFEVSTLRREVFESPGVPPKVSFVENIEEDLDRRDFKFNAIVFDVTTKEFSDKYNGLEDIEQFRISMIGNAEERLREDGLRIIRLARFASKYHLEIDQELITALEKIGEAVKFRNPVALQIEFFKLLLLPNPAFGLKLLFRYNILKALFPSLSFYAREPKETVDIKKIEQYLDRIKEIPSRSESVRFFFLLKVLSQKNELSKDLLLQISKDFKLSEKLMQTLVRLVQSWTDFPHNLDLKTLKRWIRATGINASEDLLPFIFLDAEISGKSDILSNQESFLHESQKIIQSFRNIGISP